MSPVPGYSRVISAPVTVPRLGAWGPLPCFHPELGSFCEFDGELAGDFRRSAAAGGSLSPRPVVKTARQRCLLTRPTPTTRQQSRCSASNRGINIPS
eukprot:2840989-Rhodomonas_salina.1